MVEDGGTVPEGWTAADVVVTDGEITVGGGTEEGMEGTCSRLTGPSDMHPANSTNTNTISL